MEKLYYQELNAGKSHLPVVILLHGLFGMSDNLLGLAKVLAAHFYVVIPDLMNHGRSPHRFETTYISMANDVVALMDALNITTVALVGHSMGGKVAMQIATSYPERVNRLVIVDIAPVLYPPAHKEIIYAMHLVAEKQIKQRKEAEIILSNYVNAKNLIAFFLKNMRRSEDGMWRWCFGLNEITQAYNNICAAPEFHGKFDGGALFIKGELSSYILAGHETLIREWFSPVKFKIVQGAGHWLHAEKPAVFNRLVLNFLMA